MNKRTFVKNTALMTATSLLLRTLGIVFRIFISNRVGAEGMGLYQLVFSVYVLGATFASSGIVTAVTCLSAEALTRKDGRMLSRVMQLASVACLLVGTVSAVLLYGGASLIGGWIGDSRCVPAVAVSGLALPFIGLSSCYKGYFMARRRAWPPCLSQLLEQTVRIGGILWMLGTLWDGSLEQACVIIIVGDALSETVACVYLAIAYGVDRQRVRKQTDTASSTRHGTLRALLHIAVPLTAGRYLSTALRTVENILVPARLTLFTQSDSLSLEQFGAIKGMALPLVFFPSALLLTISGLLVPELADAHALGQRRQVARLVEQTFHLILPTATLIGCLFAVLGRPLGDLLYEHSMVGLLLQILGPLAPIMYLDSVATGMLKGLNEQVHSLLYAVIDSAVRITLIWLLLPRFGITGFLFVMVVSNLLTCLLSTGRLLTVSGCVMNWRKWVVTPVFIALAAGGGWLAVKHVLPLPPLPSLLAGMLFVGGVYILLLPLCGCFTKQDLRQFIARKQ
ncbi:MAG: polysaccharide biosynthesis protein [Clostridia bacterium]|nr:polysaccharide biosynthesis protein [Clostridia bacterium]